MRKTKIVCTIGPACESKAMIVKMVEAGMNVARLNFSHGDHAEHLRRIETLKEVRRELEVPLAIMLDTKGPEIRIGRFKGGPVELREGAPFTLSSAPRDGDETGVQVGNDKLPKLLSPGDRVLLDDGLISLRVERCQGAEVRCVVENGGELSDHKSVNVPGIDIDLPYLSEADKSDIAFALEHDLDLIALSFVRSPRDVMDVRRFIERQGGGGIELIAKIENMSGIRQIDEIIKVSAGIMVARGDMGVEVPFEELPHYQKELIKKTYSAGKKVITATQMLESMIRNPRPTRAEITDVANAIYDGTSAIMLSGETASGKYPLEAVKTMAKIADCAERSIDYRGNFERQMQQVDISVVNAISHATCTTAHDLCAVAIVTVTRSGTTARMISRYRPSTDIVALTPMEKTYHQLALSWGVTPLRNEYKETSTELYQDAKRKVVEAGLAGVGDVIVITGSSDRVGEVTNTLQVVALGDILVRGEGNKLPPVTGRVAVGRDIDELGRQFRDGDILVAQRTTTELLQLVRRASGVIIEEGAADSGVGAACIALDIPVIFGAENATAVLKSGCLVTLDSENGIVFNGKAE